MDIMLPDNSTRVPQLQPNAGCRVFHNRAQLNAAIAQVNASGGEGGTALPLVDPNASFCNMFNSFDLRLTRPFNFGEQSSPLLIAGVFNLLNATNIPGVSNPDYSGYANLLVRNSNPAGTAVYLHSSLFDAGHCRGRGLRIQGTPGAFQLAVRFTF